MLLHPLWQNRLSSLVLDVAEGHHDRLVVVKDDVGVVDKVDRRERLAVLDAESGDAEGGVLWAEEGGTGEEEKFSSRSREWMRGERKRTVVICTGPRCREGKPWARRIPVRSRKRGRMSS